MASQHDRKDERIKEEVTKRTSNVITVAAIVGLVACVIVNQFGEKTVPDLVFWIFGAAIVPDAVKLFLERRT